MKKITINGVNENIRHCLDCGEKLTRDEYNSCFDKCKRCKNRYFDSGKDYTYKNGTNKIDNILIDKFRKEN